MSKQPTRIQLADELRPAVPEADYADVANEIAAFVVTETLALSDRLHHFLNERFEAAPASASHAEEFDAQLAQEVLQWIRRWPK